MMSHPDLIEAQRRFFSDARRNRLIARVWVTFAAVVFAATVAAFFFMGVP